MTFPDDYLIPGIEPFHVEEAGIIYCGRAEDILPNLTFDLIVTDPPYGVDHPCDFNKRGRGAPRGLGRSGNG